jgi:hypothetical protein
MNIETAFAYAGAMMVAAMLSEECEEDVCAFFDKRKPQWGDHLKCTYQCVKK